jgi:glycosyltransferase involved in cell wall biosynthesis
VMMQIDEGFMKSVVFVYGKMVIGGSTTSLLSILNMIDFSRYQVDLLLYEHGGDLFDMIPREVRLLPQGKQYRDKSPLLLARRMLSPSYLKAFAMSRLLAKAHGNPLLRPQIMSYESAAMSRRIERDYDIAIGFLEFWPTVYVANHINAGRKIGWLHIDYKAIGLIPSYDDACFRKLDSIVLVSKACVANFNSLFPHLSTRTACVENILSSKSIMAMAGLGSCDISVHHGDFNMVSVSRIVFSHKGLDRGVRIIRKLLDMNPDYRIKWWIIGDGEDVERLKAMIIECKLENQVVLLGKKVNPFPYVSQMDLFFLPSHYEGKPMAVTEAMMLHVPPLVTDYASAAEQVAHLVDGLVVENDDGAILQGLQLLLDHPDVIDRLKGNLKCRDYSNPDEMSRIYDLMEGAMRISEGSNG